MNDVRKFISTFMVAISNCSLYSKDHESVDGFARKTFSMLNEVLEEKLEIMIVSNDLVINKSAMKDIGLQEHNLINRMKRKHISRIDFLKDIAFSEIRQFIIDLSNTDNKINIYPHIKTGIVDIKMTGLNLGQDFDLDSIPAFSDDQINKYKECLEPVSKYNKLQIAGLEEIVINFISTFKREANILKLLSPVKSYSEYTYTHGTNVAILSMFQADYLGFGDEIVHDIGISSLLHDVGKLFVSNEILEKQGKLDDNEFREITYHTLYGARYLLNIENLPPLAAITALEHHMKYDGTGYPNISGMNNEQHLCSQIVAIADFYDAMRSHRPYRRNWEVKDILALMKKDSDTFFNPYLVDNFISSINTALMQ